MPTSLFLELGKMLPCQSFNFLTLSSQECWNNWWRQRAQAACIAHRFTKGPSLEGAVASDFSTLALSQAVWRSRGGSRPSTPFRIPYQTLCPAKSRFIWTKNLNVNMQHPFPSPSTQWERACVHPCSCKNALCAEILSSPKRAEILDAAK